MAAKSPVPQYSPSRPDVWADTPFLREPQSPVPVGIGATGGEEFDSSTGTPVFTQAQGRLGAKATQTDTVHQSDERYIVTTLSDITRCDPDVTAWIAAVRSRFANCKPLWGRSSVGTVGREP
jgi:hypothetical protein